MDKLSDLKQFCKKIIEYQKLVRQWYDSFSPSAELRENVQSLRTELQRGYSRLESTIMQYGGRGFKHVFHLAFDSFNTDDGAKERLNTLDKVIPIVNKAIGKLQLEAEGKSREVELPKKPEDTVKSPIQLFDAMQFHPKVVEASKSCFTTINYREAILNAFISLIDYIKEISGLDLDGDDLMNNVFSFNYDKEQRKITKLPIICINELKNRTDRDEQQGFMFLCKGAAAFVRNPKAHKLIAQTDPLHTLEHLAFASMLMRRVEEGKVKKTRPPRQRWNLERFLADAQERCIPERTDIMKKLIDFTVSNSDAGILWGTGAKYGSFVFQKLIENIPVSIFQVYTDGTFFLFFSPMKNKGVNTEILNQFRFNLNKIPGVTISEKVITEKNKYGSLGLNILYRDNNLKLFQDAVITLCNQLDSKGAAN